MTRLHRQLIVCMLAGITVIATAAPALADHLVLETTVPESVPAGDLVELRVVVLTESTAERVPNASIVLFREVDFLGVSGDVEVARAVTDESGVAILRFRARAGASEQTIVASASVGDSAVESHPLPVVTIGAGPQIVTPDAGLEIPGLGVWVLIALVITIWATIQFALLGPVEVARLSQESPSGDRKGSGS